MVPRNPTGSGQQRGCETTGGFPEWRLGVRGVQSQLKSSLFLDGRSSVWMLWVLVGTGECGPVETLTQRPSSPLPATECREAQHLWKAPAHTPDIQQGPSFKVRQKAGPQPALDEKRAASSEATGQECVAAVRHPRTRGSCTSPTSPSEPLLRNDPSFVLGLLGGGGSG